MPEREPDISKHCRQGIKKQPSMTSLLEQDINPLSPWSINRETSTSFNNSLALTTYTGATHMNSCPELELQVLRCSCDTICLAMAESAGVARQPFCGWEQKVLPSTGSTHIIFSQNSDQSLGSSGSCRETNRSANGAFTKSKYSVYQPTNHKRTDFRPQIRSYLHSSDSRVILYEFEHHNCGDISLYNIDKYRKTITYPKMEQKSIPLSGGVAGLGELSLWSGSRCVSSSVLKPKLFVLGEGSTASHTRPFMCRKTYAHGAGFYSMPESKPKFRLSDLNSTIQQHSSSEDRSKTEAKQYPVPIVTGFSSLQIEPPQNQDSEIEFVGAEEDSDAQLSMTWISRPVPESYLTSSVLYTAPSNTHPSIPKQRTMSALSKNSSVSNVGFRGAMNVNNLRSLNRGPGSGATLLAMAGKRTQTLSRNGTKKLTYGFQLSSHSMPLIKTAEKTSGKTNRLGHLLRRKHRSTPSSTVVQIII